MTRKRLGQKLLHALRNDIPIRFVIETLGINVQKNADRFRFQCPLCRNFDTNILTSENLARCFDCRKNFNPIDMVKEVYSVSFLDSVAFLEPLLEKFSRANHPKPASPHSPVSPNDQFLQKNDTARMTHINSILKSLPILPNKSSLPTKKADLNTILEYIQSLEQKLQELMLQVKEIK